MGANSPRSTSSSGGIAATVEAAGAEHQSDIRCQNLWPSRLDGVWKAGSQSARIVTEGGPKLMWIGIATPAVPLEIQVEESELVLRMNFEGQRCRGTLASDGNSILWD